MNKQELIDKYEATECVVNFVREKTLLKSILRDLKQLDEPEKVKVPQFVANWYEENKDDFETSLFYCIYELLKKRNDNELSEFEKWVIDENTEPFKTLVNMHQFGYEVEKEKRYLVTLKNRQPLVKSQSGSTLYFSQDITARNYKGTQKELEEAGFGWVFDCPGIEIEEVE